MCFYRRAQQTLAHSYESGSPSTVCVRLLSGSKNEKTILFVAIFVAFGVLAVAKNRFLLSALGQLGLSL
jgi:hypothetical protein